jgi:hypothetical protein
LVIKVALERNCWIQGRRSCPRAPTPENGLISLKPLLGMKLQGWPPPGGDPRRAECGQLRGVLSLLPGVPFYSCIFSPRLSFIGCLLSTSLPVLKVLHQASQVRCGLSRAGWRP